MERILLMSIIIAVIILFFVSYLLINNVSFNNYRAKISNLYCNFESLNFKDPVIFVPGLMGSILEKDGEIVWLTFGKAIKNADSLVYEETLNSPGIFTGIGPYKFYSKISKLMACQKNGYVFYYDWRDYPEKNSESLGKLVERVRSETGKNPSIIAHSMGGLVVHGYLKTNNNSKNLNKIVYVSSPFLPGIGYFDDMNDGIKILFNKNIMSKEALISHPSSFLLLPHYGSKEYRGLELLDAKIWKENKFGVFREGEYDTKKLQEMMDKIKKYHKKLDTPKKLTNDFLIIASDCYETVYSEDKNGQRNYIPGDGRVSKNSVKPKDNFSSIKEINICQKHEKQMEDLRVLKEINDFLNGYIITKKKYGPRRNRTAEYSM